jgi:hypothetical protein
LIILITVNEINAQPTLSDYNSNPLTTEHYTCLGINYITQTNSAGFSNWNFSSAKPIDTFTITYLEHGEVEGDGLFPLSDMARKTGDNYEFLITSSDGISLAGYKDSNTFAYSESVDLIRYPFNYLDRFSDNYDCKYVRNGDTIIRVGNISVNAQSWGNVRLPYGNINNVLCIKTIEDYNDYTKTGNEYHEITTFAWHVPGLSAPVLRFRSENYNGYLKESGYYLTKESLGIDKNLHDPFFVNLIQKDGCRLPVLNINSLSVQTVTIRCINSRGQEVIAPFKKILRDGDNKVNLTENEMLPGIYLIILDSDKIRITKKTVL